MCALRRAAGVALDAIADATFDLAGHGSEGFGSTGEADQLAIEEDWPGKRGEAVSDQENGQQCGMNSLAQGPHDRPMRRGQEKGCDGEPEQQGAEGELHGGLPPDSPRLVSGSGYARRD